MADNPDPEHIFGNPSEDILEQNAKRLLDNYSNPWDPVAEAVQNSVDAVNSKYRRLLANELDVDLDSLEDAIENATKAVVDIDVEAFNEKSPVMDGDLLNIEGLDEDVEWGDPEYIDWIRDRYYESLANALDLDEDSVSEADSSVRDSFQGEIIVRRDIDARKIVVEDNGVGMSSEELMEALKRYGSLKSRGGRKTGQIGEIGNGLTFLLANCSEFRIETCDGEEKSWAKISDMQAWVDGDASKEQIESSFESETVEGEGSYTKVEMEEIREGESEYPDLFSDKIGRSRMIHLIKNKTAIGQLFDVLNYPAFHTLRSKNVSAYYQEIGEDDSPEEIGFVFQGPAQVADAAGRDPETNFPTQIDVEEARARVEDRTQNIGEKSVVAEGIWESSGGVKHYYQAFVASRDRYRELSRTRELCDDPDLAVDENTFDLEPGIEIAVKGMPCGTRVESPQAGGSAGYWRNLHIIIMNNDLSFDEGREKPATGRRGKNFKDCARHVIFQEIGRDVISGTTSGSGFGTSDRESLVQDIEDKSDLNLSALDNIPFEKEPSTEQDVVAIFHEALSAGIFPPVYQGLETSTWHTYDEIYRHHVDLDSQSEFIGSRLARSEREGGKDEVEEGIVVEFKKEGSDIFEDMESNKKIYSEMDLLVCWTFDEDNEQGVRLSEKTSDEIRYWGTTHNFEIDSHLLYDQSNNVDVIVLTELFQRLGEDNYSVR
ncbi:MAG: ATP-binding protein [Candidatus Aenigmatarchaeota archaeon]